MKITPESFMYKAITCYHTTLATFFKLTSMEFTFKFHCKGQLHSVCTSVNRNNTQIMMVLANTAVCHDLYPQF